MKSKKIYYWDKFYQSKKFFYKSSNFARFLYKKKFINKKSKIIELGCGDGRDTFFFANKVNKIYAFDKSSNIIKQNIYFGKKSNFKNLVFQNIDIQKKKFFIKIEKLNFNVLYARFFLHSINEKIENKLLNALETLNVKFTIFLEFRTIHDNLMKKGKKISFNERITDHYRRYINVDDFLNKLDEKKFKIIYKMQRTNLSKYKNDNPHLCRLILKKIK